MIKRGEKVCFRKKSNVFAVLTVIIVIFLIKGDKMKQCGREKKRINAVRQWLARLNRNGMAACNEGRLEESEVILIMALYIAKLTDIPCLEAKALNNLGVFYAYRKVWDHALIYYEQALAIVYSESSRNNWFCRAIKRNVMKVLNIH
jgi:tetratricopeptide (TPR) repeat protein